MNRPDDLIQAIADELSDVMDGQPFETLEQSRQVELHGAAVRVVGYLTHHYQLGPLPPGPEH